MVASSSLSPIVNRSEDFRISEVAAHGDQRSLLYVLFEFLSLRPRAVKQKAEVVISGRWEGLLVE